MHIFLLKLNISKQMQYVQLLEEMTHTQNKI